MAGGITINGKPVENAEDQKLLKRLLEAFPEAHNGDNDIDVQEADRLMDTNGDGHIDDIDLLDYFNKHFTVREFGRAFKMFSDAGIRKLPAFEKDPASVLYNSEIFNGQPEVVEKAARELADVDPRSALNYESRYEKQPYDAEVTGTAARNLAKEDPWSALQYAGRSRDRPYAPNMAEMAATNIVNEDPGAAMEQAGVRGQEPYIALVAEKAAQASPSSAVGYQYPHPVYEMLKRSKNPVCKAIVEIIDTDYSDNAYTDVDKRKMAAILDKVISKELTIEQAGELVRDDAGYFKVLLALAVKPNAIGKYDVANEIKDISLRAVWGINNLHESPDAVRFKSVEDAGADKLYTMMVHAEEEMFTSSFKGLFNRLLFAMKKEGVSGDQLLARLGNDRFRTFVKLCASYNRLNDFLGTMPVDKQRELLVSFVSGLEGAPKPLSEAVAVADAFSMITDKGTLAILQETIKNEFERVQNSGGKESITLYGLLAGMFSKKAVINEEWIKQMSETYQLQDLTSIGSKDLFNSNGTNVQQYFFYEDKDGNASFANFTGQYKSKPGWTIEDKGTYVVVRSARVHGKRVEMYANKPTTDAVEKGPDEIRKEFEKNNLQPTVIVHRGHSYHADKTINRIPASAKIVSLGSCGGYNTVSAVLLKAPDAHIISTKQTGTMKVNDPVFKMLNEAMLKGDVNWPAFWAKVEKRYIKMEEFRSYVPPHKNLGVLFLKAYNKLVDKN